MMKNLWSLCLCMAFTASGFVAAVADEVPAINTIRIARFSGDRVAAISYTFDDGLRDQYTLAAPMLNEVGFKGTFFVIPKATAEIPQIGEKKERAEKVSDRWGGISWPELKSLAEQGHEIGSHTWSHSKLSKASPEKAELELSEAYDTLKERLGKPPLTLAFPYNSRTPEIEALALKHHVAFRSYQIGASEKTTVETLRKWADSQVQEKKWGVVMFHAIGNGYAALSDPEIFRAHLKEVKAREDEIWVDTFANVARYEKERDDAKLAVSGANGNLTCMLNGTLDPQIYNVPLTLVIEAPNAKSVRARRGDIELPAHIEKGAILVQATPDTRPISIRWK